MQTLYSYTCIFSPGRDQLPFRDTAFGHITRVQLIWRSSCTVENLVLCSLDNDFSKQRHILANPHLRAYSFCVSYWVNSSKYPAVPEEEKVTMIHTWVLWYKQAVLLHWMYKIFEAAISLLLTGATRFPFSFLVIWVFEINFASFLWTNNYDKGELKYNRLQFLSIFPHHWATLLLDLQACIFQANI